MTNQEILDIAREAGCGDSKDTVMLCTKNDLLRFAALVAKQEREACANLLQEQCEGVLSMQAAVVRECADVLRRYVATGDKMKSFVQLIDAFTAKNAAGRTRSSLNHPCAFNALDITIKDKDVLRETLGSSEEHQTILNHLVEAAIRKRTDEEDAARYRWLFGARTAEQANSVNYASDSYPLPQDVVLSELLTFHPYKEATDHMIDAAMAKENGEALKETDS